MNWWYNEPEDCDCSQTEGGLPDFLLNGANYGVQAYWGGKATTAVRMIGTHSFELFSTNSWTWMESVGTTLDVTGWRGVRPPNIRTFITGSFGVTRPQGLSKQIVRHAHPEWVSGITGLPGAVAGSGIIDGIFQLVSDLINGLCASRSQWFNRIALATLFGVAAGAAAALAAAAAVGLSATTGVVAAAGVIVGFIASSGFTKAKESAFKQRPGLFGP